MTTPTARMEAGQRRRHRVPTLVALALSALEAAGRLVEVPVLRVSRRDCRRLTAPDPLTRRPPLVALRGLAEIRLSGLGLGRVPSALAALSPGLAVLNLSRNRLTNLPRWIGRFTRLRVLDLCSNRLAQVPLCVGDLTALARLDLSQNQIEAIPTWFGPALAGLRQLNLCSTFPRGPRLPSSFAALVGLRHLSLCCSPTLAPGFDSWEDPNADSVSHPLWPPIYGLTGLRGLVVHMMSVTEVDARIRHLRNLTRIEGLYLLGHVPPELAKIRGLAHMDTCHFAVPAVPHEFYTLARQMRPRCRPLVDGATDHGDIATRYTPRWSLPSLVDLCLTALCPSTKTGVPHRSKDGCAGTDGPYDDVAADQANHDHNHAMDHENDDGDDDHDNWDDSNDDRRLDTRRAWTSGGGPFARDRDPGLFCIDDDEFGQADAALLGLPWYDDRGDLPAPFTAAAAPVFVADASSHGHPLPERVRSLLPVELVERAEEAWSRTCASCARPIIGAASLVNMVRARSPRFPLWGRAHADSFLGVEQAFCPRCAPSIASVTSRGPPS
ncbi:Leucin rich repeat domain containing protein [Pandoravirus quercus]|uniref:Leucin rich repeat domain containing protein n=1 Tax=Pandoravirus quercus TaxID=2107709 RepID=A0A2U7U7Q9_9VIRU|nr:Leucin rich repeat domain containing protein [Pandoravirus quercus]AVK74455.1 Leucin rich repeat domain containing protein [Pandoravirus quercus]